jgi:hypothetical protein
MAMNEWQQWGNSPYFDDRHAYERFGYGSAYGFGSGYPYDRSQFERSAYEPRGDFRRGEHSWRGGILGWLGAGVRAGAGWFGDRMQQWGTWFGGRLSGGTAEIGRAVRGRGEQMASALEDQDQRAAAPMGSRRNRPSRYRRPDERILDDVWHRISVAAVDPQDVEVEVNAGVVTLSGRVSTRFEKRIIEDIADGVFGVQEVHNHLRLARVASDTRNAGTGIDPLQGNATAPKADKGFDNTIGQTDRH